MASLSLVFTRPTLSIIHETLLTLKNPIVFASIASGHFWFALYSVSILQSSADCNWARIGKFWSRWSVVWQTLSTAVVIADPDMLKQILVKDFWNFPNHAGRVDLAGSFSKSVFFARDDAWKRIRRTTITPTFSAKKMKGMVALIEESCDRLMMKIEQVVDSG